MCKRCGGETGGGAGDAQTTSRGSVGRCDSVGGAQEHAVVRLGVGLGVVVSPFGRVDRVCMLRVSFIRRARRSFKTQVASRARVIPQPHGARAARAAFLTFQALSRPALHRPRPRAATSDPGACDGCAARAAGERRRASAVI